MIKKLQRRFVLIASFTVFLMMAAILIVVNITMISVIYNQAFQALDEILNLQEDTSSESSSQPTRKPMLNKHYFRVWLNEQKQIVSLDLSHDFMMDEDSAAILVKLVLANENKVQKLDYDQSTYLCKTDVDSSERVSLIAFLDYTPSNNLLNELHTSSILIGIISTLIFTLIFALVSGHAVRPLAKNIEGQKRFITNASHELKTPIAIIAANTEMIEATGGESEWTKNTMSQTVQMTKLVEELVVLSKVSELNQLEIHNVDLSALSKESADSIRALAEQQRKTFTTYIAHNAYVAGDERLVRMLTDILLENAVKYCDENGTIEMTVETKSKGKSVLLSVTNDYKDGEGLDYERFFERFYQQDASHNSKNSGFGIGLSTAQEIARMLKSTIQITYNNGKISFHVIFQTVKT